MDFRAFVYEAKGCGFESRREYKSFDVMCRFKSCPEAGDDEQVKYSIDVKSRASIVRELLVDKVGHC